MSRVLVHIDNVKKHYRNNDTTIKALDGVSFDIYENEIIGLLGVNGAGKTTLSSLLVTLHPPTSGDILYRGKSIYQDLYTFRSLISFCPQRPNLHEDLTVEQILWFAGKYYLVPEYEIKKRMEELIKRYELEAYRTSKPRILSGGYVRRLLIARSLMHNPKILVLDEPTVGLDPHIRHRLWENIRELKEQGVSVILTTHYLDEADVLSDRVVILDKGKVKLIDTPQNLKTEYAGSALEAIFIQLMDEEGKKE